MQNIQCLQGDSLSLMNTLPEGSVDMVFADPPYNLQLNSSLSRPDESHVAGVKEAWDQFQDFKSYDTFTRAWLTAARRTLKPNGSLWVMGSYHNIFRVGALLQDLGFWLLNDVIWLKNNPMPNFRGRRFTNAHETLIWAARDKKSAYTFHYKTMKALNDDLQMRSDWMLPLCSGRERLRTENGEKVHPTQKPESLLYRVVLASTNPHDLILDPFAGTGTTGAVAKKLGRRCLLIEQNPTYLHAARQRLSAITDLVPLEDIQREKRPQRVPFGRLVERGVVSPGDMLSSPCQQFKARICHDGRVISDGHIGSIHQVGAAVQGMKKCNGWTYWHMAESQVALDTLRQNLLSVAL